MKKVIRIHDNFYLNEKRYKKPKQSFIQLFKIIGNKNVVKNKSILDIGCSNGELIYNLVRKFNSNKITGYDINSKLLKLCKKKIVHENVHFKKFDISKNNKVNEKLRCQGFLDKPDPSFASVNRSYKDLPFNKNNGLVGKLFIYSTVYNFPYIAIKYPTVKTLLSRFIKHLGNVYPDCRLQNGLDKNIFKIADNTKKQLKCLIRLDCLFRKSDNINQDSKREYDVVKVLLENNKVKQCKQTCRNL